jgi:hypothetical protein
MTGKNPREPRSAALKKANGNPMDPDSVAGRREAIAHEHIVTNYLEARHALRMAGLDAERTADLIVIKDWRRRVSPSSVLFWPGLMRSSIYGVRSAGADTASRSRDHVRHRTTG